VRIVAIAAVIIASIVALLAALQRFGFEARASWGDGPL
jgi:hypothetical protein